MSGVDVWGYAGNLAYFRYFTHKGVVDAVLYRTNLGYLKGESKGYTVTGVTHGHDGHLQPREWVLGLSGMSLRYLLCTRPLEAVTKLEPFWTVPPQGAGPESREAG